MWLVSPTFFQTLILCALKIVHQYWLVVRVRGLVDDYSSSLPWGKTTNIGQALFCDNDIKIMLSLVDMRTHWDNARNTCGVGL